MRLGLRGDRGAIIVEAPAEAGRCLQCGIVAPRPEITFCRRCGLPFGSPPRADAALPSCPVCYRTMDDDGRTHARTGPARLDLISHIAEHDRFPVGDDEFLESLREGDRIRIGRHYAPFDLVRRYLVTGAVDGGRRRAFEHNAIVTAMKQLARWGAASTIIGDQADWVEARAAVGGLMERYHRGRV